MAVKVRFEAIDELNAAQHDGAVINMDDKDQKMVSSMMVEHCLVRLAVQEAKNAKNSKKSLVLFMSSLLQHV